MSPAGTAGDAHSSVRCGLRRRRAGSCPVGATWARGRPLWTYRKSPPTQAERGTMAVERDPVAMAAMLHRREGSTATPSRTCARSLVNTYTSWWRRRWNGEVPTEELPEWAAPSGTGHERLDLRAPLRWLPRRQRVQRHHGSAAYQGLCQGPATSRATIQSSSACKCGQGGRLVRLPGQVAEPGTMCQRN